MAGGETEGIEESGRGLGGMEGAYSGGGMQERVAGSEGCCDVGEGNKWGVGNGGGVSRNPGGRERGEGGGGLR